MKSVNFIVKYIVASFLIVFLFTGCGSVVISNVSVFHKLPKVEKQENINYSFLKLKGQDNNLEYDTYQEKIKQHLLLNHFVETDNSNILISFEYGVDGGKEKIGSAPIIGQTGVSSSYTTGTVNTYSGGYGSYSGRTTYTPTYGVVGSSSYSYSEYTRYLNLYIYDKSQQKVIYEGAAISSGTTGTLLPVIDEMMESLFLDFPGENGKSKIVERPSIK